MRKVIQIVGLSLFLTVAVGAISPYLNASGDFQAQAQQQKKWALVIGNKDYRYDPLANTLNDARDMSAKLKSLGFSVSLHENLSDEKTMKRAVREVIGQIQPGDTFLFYYSGHAMDVKGINYLLPTQAEINKEVDVEYEALNFNLVLDEIEAARGKANIVILDSCRNNPFIQRAGKSANKGLAIPRSPSGTYIIYATSPGKVASDNPSGRNGLFTQSLLESLSQPGLTQDQIFRFTARKVRDASKGTQEPWAGGSLIDEFYFIPPDSIPLTIQTSESKPIPLTTPYPQPQSTQIPVSLSTRSNEIPSDVSSNHWAYNHIKILMLELEVLKPKTKTQFKGDDLITRYELAESLYLLIQKLEGISGRDFSRVSKPTPSKMLDVDIIYRDIVENVVNRYGIMQPMPGSLFKGNDPISRYELAFELYDYFNLLESYGIQFQYPILNISGNMKDLSSDHWAKKAAIACLDKYQIFTAYPDSTFSGQKRLSRYEATAVIMRLVSILDNIIPQIPEQS